MNQGLAIKAHVSALNTFITESIKIFDVIEDTIEDDFAGFTSGK